MGKHGLGSKLFKCDLCDKKFTYRSKLKTHVQKQAEVPDMSLCPICGKNITSKSAMKKHIASHQRSVNADTNLKCDQCDYVGKTVGYLTRHMFDDHDHNAFFCHLCGKKCKGKNGITHHMDLNHSTEKGFDTKKTLEGHINMHLGLKPHKCEFCGQGFQNSSNLRAHKRKSCQKKSQLI